MTTSDIRREQESTKVSQDLTMAKSRQDKNIDLRTCNSVLFLHNHLFFFPLWLPNAPGHHFNYSFLSSVPSKFLQPCPIHWLLTNSHWYPTALKKKKTLKLTYCEAFVNSLFLFSFAVGLLNNHVFSLPPMIHHTCLKFPETFFTLMKSSKLLRISKLMAFSLSTFSGNFLPYLALETTPVWAVSPLSAHFLYLFHRKNLIESPTEF